MLNLSTHAKITLLLDHGYHPDTIQKALEALYPQIMTKIRFQLAPKPTKAQKAAQGKTGFVPVATRWIIERSNAWMDRCKSKAQELWAHSKPCHNEDQSVLYPIDAKAFSA